MVGLKAYRLNFGQLIQSVDHLTTFGGGVVGLAGDQEGVSEEAASLLEGHSQ